MGPGFLSENVKEKNLTENPDINRSIILKWLLKK
jgi:uncharacterized protein YneF (UPF0154 family)